MAKKKTAKKAAKKTAKKAAKKVAKKAAPKRAAKKSASTKPKVVKSKKANTSMAALAAPPPEQAKLGPPENMSKKDVVMSTTNYEAMHGHVSARRAQTRRDVKNAPNKR